MAPDGASENAECLEDDKQYLFIVRHGDRWDYSNPEWKKLPTSRTGDSPLSQLGHRQAHEVGLFLDTFFDEKGMTADEITWLSSPFVRCLQTSNCALDAFRKVNVDSVEILPEYSVFEWDGNDGQWHKDLPPMDERKHYFPRLSLSHESLFVPKLPEPRAEFMLRCEKAVSLLHKRYPFNPKKAIVIVSHAAGCIALTQVLTRLQLCDITPAGPCSIYGFSRNSNTDVWTIDAHDKDGGLNGLTSHLSEMGSTTKPWNNFGDGQRKFYTGPPTSRFAPEDTS